MKRTIMAKQVMPEARLDPRPTDVKLTGEEFLKLSLFEQLKRKPTLDKFPGAMILRRFRKGEVVFRQGEAGWTAFYPLTAEDVMTLFQNRVQARWKQTDPPAEADKESLRTWVARVKAAQRDEEVRRVGTVHLAIGRPVVAGARGALQRLTGAVFGRRRRAPDQKPRFIPIDGPRDIDYAAMEAPVMEGEIFGEMCCLYRTPRSGTVVATRDCFMLEMLRNILDQLQKDPAYKARTDEIYKKRIFELHLRKMSFLSEVPDNLYAELCRDMELLTYEGGQLIFDEHERDDGVYIVRSGLVKVVKKVSALVSEDSVRRWPDLCTALREGEQQPATPRGKVWASLPEPVRRLVASKPADQLTPAERVEILYSLNDVIKNRQFPDAKELKDQLNHFYVQARTEGFPDKRKDYSDQQAREFNRILLDTIYLNIIRSYRRRVGPECVLSYAAKGDFFGEISLLTGTPRGATCIAFGHTLEGAAKDTGRVEVVRLPPEAFRRLLDAAPAARSEIERKSAERQKQTESVTNAPVYEETGTVQFSEQFQQLGLIQGQKLMLIDLNRCTRCDECVRACVNTHDDGRSRLFLDGPRFGKYLVPTTCRACLDPVCMIGCPVGSIHRGDNNQIIIESWCIGCGLCANSCPYGSIQMHDIGIIPTVARGWRFLPAVALGDVRWQEPSYNDHRWELGTAPFKYDLNIQTAVVDAQTKNQGKPGSDKTTVCFRYEFQLSSYLLKADSEFKMEVASVDPGIMVWLNGKELRSEKPKGNKRDFWMPPKPEPAPAPPAAPAPRSPSPSRRQWREVVEAAPPAKAPAPPKVQPAGGLLRAGRNVLAVQVTPKATGGLLLELRLDALPKPEAAKLVAEEITEKLVTEQAVVCDLCSTLSRQVPACVHACPHDAAMRVDARFEFPTG
jgi:Fe-S-cluster-containing hydrogenase component 2/CRP-like cAMP-binding protein